MSPRLRSALPPTAADASAASAAPAAAGRSTRRRGRATRAVRDDATTDDEERDDGAEACDAEDGEDAGDLLDVLSETDDVAPVVVPIDALPTEDEVATIVARSEVEIARSPSGASSSLTQYYEDLRRYPLLTPEQEYEIAVLAARGSQIAQARLVLHNARFAVTVARRFERRRGAPLEDLIQQGNFGLIKAVRSFDPERGVKFVSYAIFWIRQAIQQWLASQHRAVSLPVARATQLAHISRLSHEWVREHGRRPSPEELSTKTELTPEMVATLQSVGQSEMRFDAPVPGTEDGTETFGERVPDGRDPEASVDLWDLRQTLAKALALLLPRDARVLGLFYGLIGGRTHTLEEIGAIQHITRERVRQIRDRALKRVLQGPFADELREFHLE